MYQTQYFSARTQKVEQSARVVVPLLLELCSPRSVIDVGCATGIWLSEFRERGVTDVLGVDGDYVPRDLLRIPPECFVAADLSQAVIPCARSFGLAICLEVAEHLPANAAAKLVTELARLSNVVAFSAAVPGQGGTGHINEQWQDYWADLFAAAGHTYIVDAVREQIWRADEVNFCYRQNLIVYANAAGAAEIAPRFSPGTQQPESLSRVHPVMHLRQQDLASRGLKTLTRAVIENLRRRAARRH